MISLHNFLRRVNVVSVTCYQWGDTGKGKLVNALAPWADICARGTGGNNAGHTIIHNEEEIIFHLVPAGTTEDHRGLETVLGNGMVVNLEVLCSELDDLDRLGMPYQNLKISEDASVILPLHILEDKMKNASQAKGGIGSTGRGIGPCYRDKIDRKGIFMRDLRNPQKLRSKIEKLAAAHPELEVDVNKMIGELKTYASRLDKFITNTYTLMHNALRDNKKILIEGAQGLLLSIEHGSYPYVTSSDPGLNGTASGVGISARNIDLPIGIIKFPFMTRVGGGPFPTELGGTASQDYCARDLECDIFYEAQKYLGWNGDLSKIRQLQSQGMKRELDLIEKQVKKFIIGNKENVVHLINNSNPFIQGVGIRLAAFEYGATTKRPRRVGWTDAVAGRFAVGLNGPLMFFTKPDCLSGADSFGISQSYEIDGQTTNEFTRDSDALARATPNVKFYEGYGDISEVRDYNDLPSSLQDAVLDFCNLSGGICAGVSVGPKANETIYRNVRN